MYNIGIINTGVSEKKLSTYVEKSFASFKVAQVHIDNLSNELIEKDAILIFASKVDAVVAEICQLIIEIKMTSQCFVWVLSENHDEKKRVVYLQLGIDGNINMDCSPKELQLIVTNALDRKQKSRARTVVEKVGKPKEAKAELNEKNLSFISLGEEVPLTRIEYKLFKLLLSNPGVAFSYEELFKKVWGKPYSNEKYRVANVVFHIREKLEEYSLNPNYIKTVRSIGYMICE